MAIKAVVFSKMAGRRHIVINQSSVPNERSKYALAYTRSAMTLNVMTSNSIDKTCKAGPLVTGSTKFGAGHVAATDAGVDDRTIAKWCFNVARKNVIKNSWSSRMRGDERHEKALIAFGTLHKDRRAKEVGTNERCKLTFVGYSGHIF